MKVLRYTAKNLLLVTILAIALGATSYIQAVYVGPINNPPNSNVDAPINLDDDFQDMTGGLEADALIVHTMQSRLVYNHLHLATL